MQLLARVHNGYQGGQCYVLDILDTEHTGRVGEQGRVIDSVGVAVLAGRATQAASKAVAADKAARTWIVISGPVVGQSGLVNLLSGESMRVRGRASGGDRRAESPERVAVADATTSVSLLLRLLNC